MDIFRNWMFVLQRITGVITLNLSLLGMSGKQELQLHLGAEVNFDMMADIVS